MSSSDHRFCRSGHGQGCMNPGRFRIGQADRIDSGICVALACLEPFRNLGFRCWRNGRQFQGHEGAGMNLFQSGGDLMDRLCRLAFKLPRSPHERPCNTITGDRVTAAIRRLYTVYRRQFAGLDRSVAASFITPSIIARILKARLYRLHRLSEGSISTITAPASASRFKVA